MTEEEPTIGETIQRDIRRLAAATIFVYLVLVIGGIYLWIQLGNTNQVLCTFKNDLQSRVSQTEAYIKDHPEGFPGVSNKTIQRSLDGQKATIKSLDGLSCDPVEPPAPS